MRSHSAAALCYKCSRSEVPGTWTDSGACNGLHQAESADEPFLHAEPGCPQCAQLQPQPSGLPNAGLYIRTFQCWFVHTIRCCCISFLLRRHLRRCDFAVVIVIIGPHVCRCGPFLYIPHSVVCVCRASCSEMENQPRFSLGGRVVCGTLY